MNLEHFRKHKKLTYKQLANLLEITGVSPASTVIKWCKFQRVPRSEFMKKIYRLTKGKVTPGDFYERE